MKVQTKIRPFLMFEGKAEEAMRFYMSVFPGSEANEITRYGAGAPGPEGSIMKGIFTIGGQSVLCTDSFVKHKFTFTPAFSFWVDCDSDDEIQRLTASLSEGGGVLMPLNNYGFSRKFAWVNDRYGVSWQLNFD